MSNVWMPPGVGGPEAVYGGGPLPAAPMAAGTPAPQNQVGQLLSATNPVIGMLLQAASILGINPYQLADAVTQNPEGAASILDGAGVPTPDAAAAAPLGEALIGSEPITYPDDPTQPTSNIIPGIGDLNAAQAAPGALSLATEAEAGVVPPGNAPPVQGTPLEAILSGVQAPPQPNVPQIGTPGVPSPRPIAGPTLDELIKGALAVQGPQSAGITLSGQLGRRS